MKLAKCPLCRKPPWSSQKQDIIECCYMCAYSAKAWNRYARLVPKGRMFEWLERFALSIWGTKNWPGQAVRTARNWWRNQRKKRK